MADVTNLKERVHPGKVIITRQMTGTGVPTDTDTVLSVEADYPVGSSYLNQTSNILYFKTANYGWQPEDTAS